jgi:signal transduction histidine kinase/ligand-binding sensor domain-containing protein
VFWATAPLFALDPGTNLSRYRRQNWTSENGLPRDKVTGIRQTPDGYITLDLDGRSARFDGLNFLPSRPDESPTPVASAVLRITDHAGRIWSARQSELIIQDGPRSRILGRHDGLPGTVTCLFEDRHGVVWVGTDEGLARIRNNKIDTFAATDSLAGSVILCIAEDREGDLWVGTESNGLVVIRDEKFHTYTSGDGLTADIVQCVVQDERGAIWVGTAEGLNRLENGRFSKLTAKDGLASNIILSLASAPGVVYVGTPDGLSVLHQGWMQTLTSSEGLPDDFIRSIFAESDGNVWIGTRRGLAHRLATGEVRTYTERDGLASEVVGAITQDHHGHLWVATMHGLDVWDGRHFQTLLPDTVTALYVDASGTVWASGTHGLIRISNQKITRFPSSLGLPETTYGIAEDDLHDLWLAANGGVFRAGKASLTAYADGKARQIELMTYGSGAGLRSAAATAGGHPGIWKARDGSVWLATRRGLSVVSPAKLSTAMPPVAQIEAMVIDGRPERPSNVLDLPPGVTRVTFRYTGLSYAAPYEVTFRYKLDGFDREWIDAGGRRVAFYTNLRPGKYHFQVQARSGDGVWSTGPAQLTFRLHSHFYQTVWFDVLLFAAIAGLGYEVYRLRVRQVQAQFDAVLAERNRIAREIHDTLAQAFVAVSVQLEVLARTMNVSPEAAASILDNTRTLVREGISEARRAIWDLRSQTTTDDLAVRISKMAGQVTAASPLRVKLNVGGAYRPLSPEIESELLRIGQEAITNVVRHAGAKNVLIDLNFDPNKVRMTIEDDGHGFSTVAHSFGPNGHFGIQGMKERAGHIDADFEIASEPGRGTKVLIEKVIR